MGIDALELVKLRSSFYRDGYRRLVFLLFISWAVIAILALAIFYQVQNRPTPTYFATTESGRIIPLVPLNKPNLSDQAILQWASQAVLSLYSYGFSNYQQIFQNNRQYFTTAGWQQFNDALTRSRNLQTVISKKIILSAVLSGAPVVQQEYVQDGRYTWKIQMPILVNYQSLSDSLNTNYMINLTVQRISTLDDITGVGIVQFNQV